MPFAVDFCVNDLFVWTILPLYTHTRKENKTKRCVGIWHLLLVVNRGTRYHYLTKGHTRGPSKPSNTCRRRIINHESMRHSSHSSFFYVMRLLLSSVNSYLRVGRIKYLITFGIILESTSETRRPHQDSTFYRLLRIFRNNSP